MATRAQGKITTLIADRVGAAVILDNDPATGPKENVWRLGLDHVNYNALYSLCLAAAANRWSVTIRIAGDEAIDAAREAAIKSIGVEF